MSERDWDERYRTGQLPWDTGTPEQHLLQVVDAFEIAPGLALEVGCGTGTNAIWLAQNGFDVTAVDTSPTAIGMAKEKAAAANVAISFHVGDFLHDSMPCEPVAFAFDRGCFHSFDSAQERIAFANQVAGYLRPGGLWLSLIGSADGAPREVGPPRRSVGDITAAVEARFEIRLLKADFFNSDQASPPEAWVCLMRNRGHAMPISA